MAQKKPPLGTGERFAALRAILAAKGVRDPDALAAAIGRRKYGKRRFQALAAAGRRRHSRLKSKRMRALFNRQ